MGDPAGIGPEIIAKAFTHADTRERARMVVVGDVHAMEKAVKSCDLPLGVSAVLDATDVASSSVIPVLQTGPNTENVTLGEVSREAGECAYQYVRAAAELAVAGKVQAICTAPLNKSALKLAGHDFAGHTELLAELTGVEEVSMMLSTTGLKVIHVTTHIGLLDAIDLIEPGLVERTIRRGHHSLKVSGVSEPRVGVLAINPHAGEGGLFGNGEEQSKIIPAIERCQAEGMNVSGPLPADTAFFRAMRGDFDLLVAMYHDQGHGPVKAVGLDDGVNITVGLPVIRTSVDHGTAFDIAGTGVASEASFLTAVDCALELANGTTISHEVKVE